MAIIYRIKHMLGQKRILKVNQMGHYECIAKPTYRLDFEPKSF